MYSLHPFIWVIFLFIGLPLLIASPHDDGKVREGVLDLRHLPFESSGSQRIEGDWDFFWKHFIPPSDSMLMSQTRVEVPHHWAVNGFDNHGYASYRVKILLPYAYSKLSLYIPEQAHAYRALINGRLVAAVGQVGKNAEEEKPATKPQIINFTADGATTLHLVFHISNYHHKKGGLWDSIVLGLPNDIRNDRNKRLLITSFLMGSILIICLYHFVIFILRPSDKTALFFSLLCLLSVFRLISTGDMLVLEWGLDISWEWRLRMEHLPFYWMIVMGVAFTKLLFPEEFSSRMVQAVGAIGICCGLINLFLPASIHSYLILYYQGWTLAVLVYSLFISTLAIKHGKEGAIAYALGLIVVIGTALNDMLYSENIISSMYIAPLGIFLFFFFQAVVLSIKSANAYRKAERYAHELLQLNTHLEEKVNERTVQLEETTKQIKLINHDLQLSEADAWMHAEELKDTLKELKEAKSLVEQSEKMASLGQLTAGIAHEINNPLNFVFGGTEGVKSLFEDLKCVILLHEQILSASTQERALLLEKLAVLKKEVDYDNLINDISTLLVDIKIGANRTAEIVKGLRTFSRLDKSEAKETDIHLCIDSTLIILRNEYKGRIEIIKKYDTGLPLISCLAGQINQVLMNIINNAIQAIEGSGSITITTQMTSSEVLAIIIADTGPGIPEAVQQKIFTQFFTTKEVGFGTGLGLAISQNIIAKHHGRIDLRSELGKGSAFTIYLPVQMDNKSAVASIPF